MKQSQFYELQDLLDQIKAVDKMIQLHYDAPTAFMLNQYKATKAKLINNFIGALVAPPFISSGNIHTIKMVIDKFYGDEFKNFSIQSLSSDLLRLEQSLA